jgi:transcriptional regulator with XRE-family HTH domain
MKDRIKEYIDYKGISPGELASLLEVQRSNISHILNGRNKPGASLIEKLLIVFPDLNARWLMTGEGSMTGVEPTSIENPKTESKPNSVVEEQPQYKKSTNESNRLIDKVVLIYNDGSFSAHNPA